MSTDAVLVTGASGGIGVAVARAFAAAGHPVAVHGHRGKERAERVAAEIRKSGVDARVCLADLATPAGVDQLIADVNHWAGGPLSGLVHAAGITRDGPVTSLTQADWDRVIAIHLSAARGLLAARLIGPGGFAVLIGSGAGRHGRAGQAAYAAAKAGQEALTTVAARELAADGIRVNTVIPGPVDTPMWGQLSGAAQRKIMASYALTRINAPGEVAAFVVKVAAMAATSGQVIPMDNRLRP